MRREGRDKSCSLYVAAHRRSIFSNDPLWVISNNGCQPAVTANASLFYVVTTQVRCPTGPISRCSGQITLPAACTPPAIFMVLLHHVQGRLSSNLRTFAWKWRRVAFVKPLKSRISLGVLTGRGLLQWRWR